jgi:membrane protein DedA with SNARE-associated domain
MTVTPREVARVFAWFERHGAASVFFGRMVPAVRAVISIPAGIARMPLGRFLLYSTLGSTIWMGALGYAGYVLGQNYLLVAKYVEPGTKVIAALVVLTYFFRLAMSFRKERPKAG